MTSRTLTSVLLMTMLTACLTSQPALSVAKGDPQRGALGDIYLSDGRQISGELLAVDDSSIVLLTSDRIAIAPVRSIYRIVFDNFEISAPRAEPFLWPSAVQAGREASRFPYGLTAPMMSALLANAKQAAPDRLEATKPMPDAEAFVAEARDANRRYESQQAAIDDGFTRVGVEFPAMGEHWVSFARVNEDSFAANRPSVLIYTNVAGAPRLAGVAYTKLISGRQEPPDFPFAGGWHEHSGAVNEESLPLGHAHAKMPKEVVVPSEERDLLFRRSEGPRLFILHAWIYTQNPDGVFATDNWSLPLIRLGVGQQSVDRDALRAIALAQDGDEYHRLMLRASLNLPERDDEAVARVIDAQRVRAEQDVAATKQLTRETSARLANTWNVMWLELERALPTRVAELRHLRAAM